MNSSKAIKKYRPYLTLKELQAVASILGAHNISPASLLASMEDRKACMDAQYVIDSLLRDISYEKRAPDIVTTGRVLNASVSLTDMFSANEIPIAKDKSTFNEIFDNASEYEQDIICLKTELEMNFITQELFNEKLIALRVKHNIVGE